MHAHDSYLVETARQAEHGGVAVRPGRPGRTWRDHVRPFLVPLLLIALATWLAGLLWLSVLAAGAVLRLVVAMAA
ncbi:MAG: hypothetical protein HY332_06585 [Chloroflexi bacterium]|nr:hypothetical protein [Chloroflexota bacterium]